MEAEIITIGDELLIGQTVDTNSAYLGQKIGKHRHLYFSQNCHQRQ